MFSFVRLLRRFVFPIFRFYFAFLPMDLQGVKAVVDGTRLVEFISAGCVVRRGIVT